MKTLLTIFSVTLLSLLSQANAEKGSPLESLVGSYRVVKCQDYERTVESGTKVWVHYPYGNHLVMKGAEGSLDYHLEFSGNAKGVEVGGYFQDHCETMDTQQTIKENTVSIKWVNHIRQNSDCSSKEIFRTISEAKWKIKNNYITITGNDEARVYDKEFGKAFLLSNSKKNIFSCELERVSN